MYTFTLVGRSFEFEFRQLLERKGVSSEGVMVRGNEGLSTLPISTIVACSKEKPRVFVAIKSGVPRFLRQEIEALGIHVIESETPSKAAVKTFHYLSNH